MYTWYRSSPTQTCPAFSVIDNMSEVTDYSTFSPPDGNCYFPLEDEDLLDDSHMQTPPAKIRHLHLHRNNRKSPVRSVWLIECVGVCTARAIRGPCI